MAEGHGNRMSCTDFCFVTVFISDLGGGGCTKLFFDEGKNGTDDEEPGTPSDFFLSRFPSKSCLSFLSFKSFPRLVHSISVPSTCFFLRSRGVAFRSDKNNGSVGAIVLGVIL